MFVSHLKFELKVHNLKEIRRRKKPPLRQCINFWQPIHIILWTFQFVYPHTHMILNAPRSFHILISAKHQHTYINFTSPNVVTALQSLCSFSVFLSYFLSIFLYLSVFFFFLIANSIWQRERPKNVSKY